MAQDRPPYIHKCQGRIGCGMAQPRQKRHVGGKEEGRSSPVGKNEARVLAAVLPDDIAPIAIALVNASLAQVDPYVSSTGVAEGSNISFELFTATTWHSEIL